MFILGGGRGDLLIEMRGKVLFFGFVVFLVLVSVVGTVVAWKFVGSGFGILREVRVGSGVVGSHGGQVKFSIIPQNKSIENVSWGENG